MEGCLRASSARARIALSAVALAVAGCSSRTTLVVVDPYPCGDGEATGCAPGLLDDLIGFWRLNDASGSVSARDWSGWRNDGTLVNIDPASAWVAAGPEGGALAIDGQGYVNVPTSASIDSISTQVTLAAWMYLDGTIMDYATAISRQIGTGYGQHYHLSVNSKNQAILFITTPASNQVVLGGPMNFPQQTWVHLAGTYDGSMAHLYVDGVEAATPLPVSGAFATETNPVVLSGNGNGTAQTVSELVPGRLADVMLYRRALSADEIKRIHDGALLASTGSQADAGR
jgi:hypothetical protein